MKYIAITGGLLSGVGKGLTASSIARILKNRSINVTFIKIDPYLNCDASNLSPNDHGEVFVLSDGGEVDLDFGNYERFMHINLRKDNNITTGKVFKNMVERERSGFYDGKTVQITPHATDYVVEWIETVAKRKVLNGKECNLSGVMDHVSVGVHGSTVSESADHVITESTADAIDTVIAADVIDNVIAENTEVSGHIRDTIYNMNGCPASEISFPRIIESSQSQLGVEISEDPCISSSIRNNTENNQALNNCAIKNQEKRRKMSGKADSFPKISIDFTEQFAESHFNSSSSEIQENLPDESIKTNVHYDTQIPHSDMQITQTDLGSRGGVISSDSHPKQRPRSFRKPLSHFTDLNSERAVVAQKLKSDPENFNSTFHDASSDEKDILELIQNGLCGHNCVNTLETPDVCIIELGGTIGDIESSLFVEALRQLRNKVGPKNFITISVEYVLILPNGEQKTKPVQNSLIKARGLGIHPDLVVVRCPEALTQTSLQKIANFGEIKVEHIFQSPNVDSFYEIPVLLNSQGICEIICDKIELPNVIVKDSPFFDEFKFLNSCNQSKKYEKMISEDGNIQQIFQDTSIHNHSIDEKSYFSTDITPDFEKRSDSEKGSNLSRNFDSYSEGVSNLSGDISFDDRLSFLNNSVISKYHQDAINFLTSNSDSSSIDPLIDSKLSCLINSAHLLSIFGFIYKKYNKQISIAIVGKYISNSDTYISLLNALLLSTAKHEHMSKIKWIDAVKLENNDQESIRTLRTCNGIVVAGGFGVRGTEGKITAIKIARENKIPILGICLGFQLQIIEYARNVINLKQATSEEFVNQNDTKSQDFELVITKINSDKMSVGTKQMVLKQDSFLKKIYNKDRINERYRHKYEFNNEFSEKFANTDLVFSGTQLENRQVALELKNHPFFVGVQYHPEFLARPEHTHPLFDAFLRSCIKRGNK